MPTRLYTKAGPRSRRRTGLPLLLYDLAAASQALSPAVVLPEQFATPVKPWRASGEAELMRAVLEDALHCFQQSRTATAKRRTQRLAREAESWFFSDDTRWPFSFVNICAVLGLDPEYIRLGLKRWCQHGPLVSRKVRRRTVACAKPLKIAA
jgi:hypothetical protein